MKKTPLRINTYLAHTGIGSRRYCERLIKTGQVKVNNVPVTTLSRRIEVGERVTVNGNTAFPVKDTELLCCISLHAIYAVLKTHIIATLQSSLYLLSTATSFLHRKADFLSTGLLLFTIMATCTTLTPTSSRIEREYM